mgnify:FL=1
MALTYNGYKNYETWFIKFHYFNEEELWYDYEGIDLYQHVKDGLMTDSNNTNKIINHFLTYVHFEEIYETIQDHKEEYSCQNCGEYSEDKYCCKECEEENYVTMTYEKG